MEKNVGEYAGLLGRACPAAVYEYVDASETDNRGAWDGKKLVINSHVSLTMLWNAVYDMWGHRIVFIASYAILKYLRKTLHGLCQRERGGPKHSVYSLNNLASSGLTWFLFFLVADVT